MIWIIALGALVVLIAYFAYFKDEDLKGQPPGPKGLPFIGTLLEMDRTWPFLTFNKWVKKYGKFYTTKMGPHRIYVVSDHKMMKELFATNGASGRPDIGDAVMLFEGHKKYGLIHTEGESWEQLRRFTLRHLRDFGFGKNTMENLIFDEMSEVLDWFKEQDGKSVTDLKVRFILATVNSLWTICTGERFKQNDSRLINLSKQNTEAIKNAAKKGLIILFMLPWVGKLFPELSGYNGLRRVLEGLKTFFTAAVEEHKATYNDDYQRDFIDVFLKEMKNTTDPKSPFYGSEGERQLLGTIGDLFQAGQDTTSTALDWIVLYLIRHPEKQKKLQKSIEKVTGNNRLVTLADRPNLPYVEATIAEVLRCANMTPAGVPHKIITDMEFRGYFLPKGSFIMPNVYHVHKDPEIWGDPDNFRPERFLSEEEDVYRKHDALMPFLVGRRQCAGETLARDSLFLYTGNLFQKFEFSIDPDRPTPTLDPAPGAIFLPQQYYTIVKERAT